MFAARCAATVAVAAASWWLIEQPIRRWRPARVPLLPLAAATVASAAAATLLVVPVGIGPGLHEPGLPPGVNDPHGALASLNVGYHISHRKNGRVLFDASTGTIFPGMNNDVYILSSEAGGSDGVISRVCIREP